MKINPVAVVWWVFCAGIGWLIGGLTGAVAGVVVGIGVSFLGQVAEYFWRR